MGNYGMGNYGSYNDYSGLGSMFGGGGLNSMYGNGMGGLGSLFRNGMGNSYALMAWEMTILAGEGWEGFMGIWDRRMVEWVVLEGSTQDTLGSAGLEVVLGAFMVDILDWVGSGADLEAFMVDMGMAGSGTCLVDMDGDSAP